MNKSVETPAGGSNTQAKLVGLVISLCLFIGLVGMLVARWASPRLDGATETMDQILSATQLGSTELASTEMCDGSMADGLEIEMTDPEVFRRSPVVLSNIDADRAEVRFTELRPKDLSEGEEFDPIVMELIFSRRSNSDWCLWSVEVD